MKVLVCYIFVFNICRGFAQNIQSIQSNIQQANLLTNSNSPNTNIQNVQSNIQQANLLTDLNSNSPDTNVQNVQSNIQQANLITDLNSNSPDTNVQNLQSNIQQANLLTDLNSNLPDTNSDDSNSPGTNDQRDTSVQNIQSNIQQANLLTNLNANNSPNLNRPDNNNNNLPNINSPMNGNIPNTNVPFNNQFEENDDEDYGRRDYIWRPCPLEYTKCVRSFFAYNSDCTPMKTKRSRTYKLETLPLSLPHANQTFELNHFIISGLNRYRIEEFYINKRTDVLVLEVVFDSIVLYSDGTRIKYYRKGQRPVVLSDYSIVNHNNISLTLTINHIKRNGISPSNGHIFTYIPNPQPWYHFGPGLTSSTDPQVLQTNAERTVGMNYSLQEAFVTLGQVFFYLFFENNVCDFKDYDIKELFD